MMRVYWTQSSDGSVNKGQLFMDRTVMNGMTHGMAEFFVWDMGTEATKRFLEIKEVCLAYCGSPTNWYGYHEVSGDVVKSSFFQVQPAASSGIDSRVAAAFNLANNTAAIQIQFITIANPRDDQKNDPVTWDYGKCYTRTATEDGEDWDYHGQLDCDPTLSMSYPGLSTKDVAAINEANVNDGVLFGDMPDHPASI